MTELEKNHKWSIEELKSIAQAKVRGETVLADSLQAVSAKYDLKKPDSCPPNQWGKFFIPTKSCARTARRKKRRLKNY